MNDTFSNTSIYDDQPYSRLYDDLPEFLQKELPIVYGLIGVLLNVLLIIYFVKSGKYRIPTFTLLTNLAVFDVLTCAVCAGDAAILFPTLLSAGFGFACPLFVTMGVGSLAASAYFLVFFAALRFYQLAFPLLARARITCAFVVKGCLLIQVLAFIYGIGNGLLYRPVNVIYRGKESVICMCTYCDVKDLIWNILAFSSCGAILILHVAKYIVLAMFRGNISDNIKEARRNADAKAVTIVITLFFVAFFTPNLYTVIQYKAREDYDSLSDNLFILLVYVTFANSTLNPLVYCFAAKSVRDDIKLMCTKSAKIGRAKQSAK